MPKINDAIPQNVNAEEALIGLTLTYDIMDVVFNIVEDHDFYSHKHQLIWSAMVALYDRGEHIDLVSVSGVLEQREHVIHDQLGGYAYMAKLVRRVADNGIGIEGAENFAASIKDKSLARQGMNECAQGVRLFQTEPAEQALAKMQASLETLGQKNVASDFTPLSSIMSDTIQRISAMHDRGGVLVGVTTGFHDLDKLLGGLRDEKLYMVAGRPGMGKTSWALTVAYNAALKGRKVGILSLEMGKDELSDRLIAIDAKLDSRRVSSGQIEDDEWDRIVVSGARLAQMPISIDDTFGSTLLSLKSKARRLQAKEGLDLLIVDYLQLMDGDGDETENEVKLLSEISRGLKGIARELCIPVVALAQLNREVEKRPNKMPQLSDLRGSGSLEQDADVVIFLYRDEKYNKDTDRKKQADVIVAKHRGGPEGVVTLGFEATETRFFNLEMVLEDPYAEK